MTMAHADAPPLERILAPKLRHDEQLLWIGQPDPELLRGEVWRLWLIFSVLLAGCAAIGIGVSLLLEGGWIPPAVVAVLFCMALFLSAPWRYRSRANDTIYAVTDQRAIVYRGFGWSPAQFMPALHEELCSVDAGTIRARRLIPRYAGRTDLVFDGERHYHSNGRGRKLRTWVQIGFLGLANVEEVDEILERQFPASGPRSARSLERDAGTGP
jgi:hypothetical protein